MPLHARKKTSPRKVQITETQLPRQFSPLYRNKINVPCSSFAGFSDDNSEWLTPAKRKRKIDHSEGDEDSDSQWEEEEEGEKEQLEADDDDDDMVDDYGAMEDSSEGEEREEEEAGSDGEEV